MIYIYALVGFSLLRAFFSPGEYLYCSTLWQCTVTVIRYGLIGDMFDVSTVFTMTIKFRANDINVKCLFSVNFNYKRSFIQNTEISKC